MNNNESLNKYLAKLKEQASIKPVKEKKIKPEPALPSLLDALEEYNKVFKS